MESSNPTKLRSKGHLSKKQKHQSLSGGWRLGSRRKCTRWTLNSNCSSASSRWKPLAFVPAIFEMLDAPKQSSQQLDCSWLSYCWSIFALFQGSCREGNTISASSVMIQRKASYKLMLELSCSISQMPTQTSLTSIECRHAPRFRRSCSGERSRSKDHMRNTIQEAGFFIKNLFTQASLGEREEERKEKRVVRREGTPAKENKRRNLHMPDKQAGSAMKGTAWARKCEQLTQLLEKSQSYTYELESKIAMLEKERAEKDDFSKQNEGAQKEQKRNIKNGLAKMRKLIAETKIAETTPVDHLALQVKMLQAQNMCLRDKNMELLQLIRENSEAAGRLRSEQEKELQAFIKELKLSLKQREKEAEGLRVELRMIKLKQSKQEENREVTKKEEVAYLKFRYENLRKKFQEANRALREMEQKEKKNTRAKYLFPDEARQLSLSLSP